MTDLTNAESPLRKSQLGPSCVAAAAWLMVSPFVLGPDAVMVGVATNLFVGKLVFIALLALATTPRMQTSSVPETPNWPRRWRGGRSDREAETPSTFKVARLACASWKAIHGPRLTTVRHRPPVEPCIDA